MPSPEPTPNQVEGAMPSPEPTPNQVEGAMPSPEPTPSQVEGAMPSMPTRAAIAQRCAQPLLPAEI